MANRIGAFGYMECSAKTKDGVREVFEMATRAALQARKGKKNNKCLLLWTCSTGLKPQIGVQNVCRYTRSFLKLAKHFGRKNNCSVNFIFVSTISYWSVLSVFKKFAKGPWLLPVLFVFDVFPEFCDIIKATPTCQMLSCDSNACQSSAHHNAGIFFFFFKFPMKQGWKMNMICNVYVCVWFIFIIFLG